MISILAKKILFSLIYSILVLIVTTDFLSAFVENKMDVKVKVNSQFNIVKAYLLPSKIDQFYLFYEASGGSMCHEKTIILKDSFLLLNDITPSIVYFIGENKEQGVQTFKMNFNRIKDYYEIQIANEPSQFNYIEYVLYHFFKFIITMSFLLIIFLCIDYYLNDSFKKYKKLNLAISVALSLIAGSLPYLILLRIYFPIN
jgi:magnesium-transporting ATPase (P-type)